MISSGGQYPVISTPLGCLPHELLSDIATLAFQSFPLHSREAILCRADLIATSRLCRDVCLATPTLWTTITIEPQLEDLSEEDTSRAREALLYRVQLSLARSGDASLDLLFACSQESNYSLGEEVLGIVRPHLPRCCTIRAKITTYDAKANKSLIQTLFPLPGMMPRLRELRFCGSSLEPAVLVGPTNASPLSILDLTGSIRVDATYLHTQNISVIELSASLVVTTQHEFLSKCSSSLAVLRLSNPVSSSPLNLPNLRCLCISPAMFEGVCESVSLASIDEIIVYSPLVGAWVDTKRTQPLPWSNLRTLTLATGVSQTLITKLTRMIPSITTLDFKQRHGLEVALQHIATDTLIIDHLTTLQVFCGFEGIPSELLVRLLNARPGLVLAYMRSGEQAKDAPIEDIMHRYPDRIKDLQALSVQCQWVYGRNPGGKWHARRKDA